MERTPRSIVLFLSAATLLGCGSKAPPPGAPAAEPASAPAPAKAGTRETRSGVYGGPSVPVAGRAPGTVIHTQDAEEFRYVVLRELTDRYAASQGITVTQPENEAYVAHLREALSKDLAVAAELVEESTEDHAARLEIAETFIKQWKINRALYQQYGGRIIFRQGGPEPLDAYRAFLEERQAADEFDILDASTAAAFWRYHKDDSIHSFIERGSAEEAKAFGVEPWSSRSWSGVADPPRRGRASSPS
jgi:hypothetical protein